MIKADGVLLRADLPPSTNFKTGCIVAGRGLNTSQAGLFSFF